MATTMLSGRTPALPIVDALLTDIARRVQLSPTAYGVAVDRYEAVCNWLQRDGSPIAHVFTRLYPQGSFAIGATIGLAPEKWRVPLEVKGELDDEAATVHEGI